MWVKIEFDFVKEKRGNIFHFWFKTLVFVCLFKKKRKWYRGEKDLLGTGSLYTDCTAPKRPLLFLFASPPHNNNNKNEREQI